MSWWDAYFDELYLRMLQATLPPEQTAQELAGVLAMLELQPGARILDLCCGQGRHAIPLARAGYRVVGLDRSPYLLGQARQAANGAGAGISWVQGDMRHLPWAETFDACLNLFTSFGYFEAEDQNQQVLVEVFRALKPGGRFILDLSNRDYFLLRLWPYSWRRYGQAILLENTTFDPATCRFASNFTWVEGERRESLSHSVRHYTAPELEGMLWRAGLVPLALYGGFDASPLDLESKRLIVVAKKPE
jgi:SAM-dependent methyltransferase